MAWKNVVLDLKRFRMSMPPMQPIRLMKGIVVTLALLLSIWSAADLHSHDAGWHAPAGCVVCLLEQAGLHGHVPAQASAFAPAMCAETLAFVPRMAFTSFIEFARIIRAPPAVLRHPR